MSSLKMTFSLTSLIFLIALGLVAMPVLGNNATQNDHASLHGAGIQDGDGHTHPAVSSVTAVAKRTTPSAYTPARNAYKVLVTFDQAVAIVSGNDTIQWQPLASDDTPLSTYTSGGALSAAPGDTTNTKFETADIDFSSYTTASKLRVKIPAAVAEVTAAVQADSTVLQQNGNLAYGPIVLTGLPLIQALKVRVGDPVQFEENGVAVSGKYTVDITFGDGTTAPDPVLDPAHIAFTPKNGATIVGAIATPDSAKPGVYRVTVQLAHGVDMVTLTVDPVYAEANAAGSNAVKISTTPAITKTKVKPTVNITLVSHDEAMKSFKVLFSYVKATVDAATQTAVAVPGDDAFDADDVAVTKSGTGTTMVDAVIPDPEVSSLRGDGQFVVTIDYSLEPDGLPLYVTVADTSTVSMINGMAADGTSTPALKVMAKSTPMAPDAPTGVTATANQDMNIITIGWMKPNANGADITGYTITQTGQATATYTAAADATSHETDALAAGNYMFTVKATNRIGDSVASDSASATIEDATTTEDTRATAMFSGTLSLTGQSIITVTLSKAAMLTIGDFEPTNGTVTGVRAKAATATAPANTVWEVAFNADPNPFMEPVGLTIKDDSMVAKPAATMGSLNTRTPDAVLNTITAATGADDRAPFIVILTFATVLPTGVTVEAADIKVTPTTATVGTPVGDAGDAKMWRVQITPVAGMDTKVELSDAGKVKFGTAAAPLDVPKYTAVTTTPTSAEGMLSDLSVAAESFIVIVRNTNVKGLPDSLPSKASKVMWADMPDLEDLLYEGGSIVLTRAKTPKLDHDAKSDTDARDAAARDLIITEVMWAKNTALSGKPGELDHQWIEIYNPLKDEVGGVTLKTKKGRPALDKTGDDVLLDRLSNQVGNGWELSGLGQNGSMDNNPDTNEVDFISMYRKERGKDGWVKGHWAQSSEIAITGHKATPGRLERKKSTAINVTEPSGSPFVINEFGIGDSDGEDWVELRNVTDSNQDLKNYLLTSVTGLDKEEIEFHFHDKGLPVPPKGIVVVVSRDPKDTDMATGVNLGIGADDQEEKGAQHLYVVRSFELPTGKFNLILRNGYNNKPEDFLQGKKLDNIVDALGSLKIPKETATFKSDFWPLNGKGAPHGDVIDGKGQDFKEGTVYVRNKSGKNEGMGEHHLAVVGYTGIGYDRDAARTDENGGTPGYDNGAIKGKLADLSSDATVTFSEIMLDTGPKNRRLPQWIELYNSSMTQAVNLNGWKLTVENSATDAAIKTRVDATITLKSTIIAPNQTVLIVTTAGLNSGTNRFPRNRVVNLWTDKDHRTALGTTGRTEQVFSTVGLYLKLTDADNKLVDEFGNLDGLSRTRREIPTWDFPMNKDNGDDSRSSLIRRYVSDNDETTPAEVALDGTEEKAWVLASETNFANIVSSTFYGDRDDNGTPGFRGGGPLPVSLSKFRPERLKDTGEIVVRWITESELNNAGFNILRSEKRDGEFTKVHYVAGQGTTSERTVYEWKDTSAKPNVVYYYQIQDISLDGEVTTLRTTHLRGNVTAAGKLTTTWGEIKALQ